MAEGDNTNDNWLMNALLGYGASSKAGKGLKGASKIIGKTADQNIAFAKDITGQNIAGYQPFAQFGTNALSNYADAVNMAKQGDYSFFQNTPDYKVGYDALINSANRSLAQRGNALGGGAVRDIGRLGADYASQKYNDALARMRGDIGIGYPAIGSIAGERSNLASNFMNQNMMKGSAQATAKIGKGNIWSKYMEDLIKGYYGSDSEDTSKGTGG
jgi:hypothetical protein